MDSVGKEKQSSCLGTTLPESDLKEWKCPIEDFKVIFCGMSDENIPLCQPKDSSVKSALFPSVFH